MRKRKTSDPSEEDPQSEGGGRTGQAQVIRVVHISNVVWLCLGLVIGQFLILKYQASNPPLGQDVSVGGPGPRYSRRSSTATGEREDSDSDLEI